MNNNEMLQEIVFKVLKKLEIDVDLNFVEISDSKDKSHGDYASNIALKLSSKLKMNPREIATKISNAISDDRIDHIEIAGPGFINFFVKSTSLNTVIPQILSEQENFGNGEKKNITYNIEYVSANPTGDLHLGHARGAALGDSLSRIYKKAGYTVIREFYVNDAGAQVNNLAKSLKSRYFELFDKKYPLPEDGYHGEDVIIIAKSFKEEFSDKYLDEDDSNLNIFRDYGLTKELEKLKNDLKEFKTEFDVFSFETNIRANNRVEKLFESMSKYTYVQDGATFLKTTDFLDDKDRPIIKSNGDYTYFAPDIAYHLDKLSRNANYLIDVLGADHHGYINRMKSALMMNGYSSDVLDVEMIQMVRIIKDGEEVKMSKRLGNAIKMRDLISLVGVDSVRYFFVERASTSHLDFNLDVALAQSSQNPVFYAQYAHARIQNILALSTIEPNSNYDLLVNESELSLMKCLNEYGNIIQDAARDKAPYKICGYIQKLSTYIHEYYAKVRILDNNNPELTGARLSLMKACAIVLKDALNLIGVSAPNKM